MPTRKDAGEASALDLHTTPVTYGNAQRSGTKIRNLDAMLAQLCTLDRALDNKASAKKKKQNRETEDRKRKSRHAEKKDKARKNTTDIGGNAENKQDSVISSPRGGARDTPRTAHHDYCDVETARPTRNNKQTQPQQSARPACSNVDLATGCDGVVYGSRRAAEEILSRDEAKRCSSGSNGASGGNSVNSKAYSGGKLRSLQSSTEGVGGSASGRKVENGGKGSPNAPESHASLNEIERNIREMAQAIGICPQAARNGGKINHDIAYEEDVLRSKVRSISVGDDDFSNARTGARNNDESKTKARSGEIAFALKYDEINIKEADDEIYPPNGDCDVTTQMEGNAEGAGSSRIRPRGGEHEKRDFNGVFVPKKTERSLDRSARGVIDKKTSAQRRAECEQDISRCDRRLEAGAGERNSPVAEHSNEESCRVIVVRNPKLYKKKKKSSRKEKHDKDNSDVREKEEKRKSKSDKHKKHKHRTKEDGTAVGNLDLVGPFENYIAGETAENKNTTPAKQEKLEEKNHHPDFHKRRETDEEKKRRRAERKMLEKRNNKASSSDEGIARSPSKTKKHGTTLQKRESQRENTDMYTTRRQQTLHDAPTTKRDLERLLKAKDGSRREGKDDDVNLRAYGTRPVRKTADHRAKVRPEKPADGNRTSKTVAKVPSDRRTDQSGGPATPNRGSRMADVANWHTGVYDAKTLIRPGRREKKSKHDAKYPNGRRGANRRHSSPSDLSASSYSSLSPSSRSSSSSYATSDVSSVEEPRNDGRRTRANKYNKQVKTRSSSRESGGKVEQRMNGHSKPYYFKSASSTSSFQRRPDDKRRKPEKRGDVLVKRKGEEGYHQRGNSPVEDKLSEPQFGAQRKKRTNTSVKAEGEDSHSLWQHHQLVVVSQKPEADGQKSVATKPTQQQKLASTQKKPVSAGGGVDKRSLTIRDLYSLHNVLSDTQNGTVISGYRRSDGLRVAIKRISKAGTTRWGWLGGKVVPLELALICQVNEVRSHGIVEIVEWHETTEAFLLVMVRPHPAVDLYDYVSKRKRVKESLARHIIRQLVGSLQHCIKCGVLHRDVKLENILLNPETMNVTLIDFGCGDYVRNGSYKEFAGTPEYYPPEWFARKHYNGEAMTVWSIGVLLYSLLCGTLPYRSSKEIMEKEATKFPSDVSRGGKDIVALMLQKNPRDRPSLSNILSHSWLSKSSKTSSST